MKENLILALAIGGGSLASIAIYALFNGVANDYYYERPVSRRLVKSGGLFVAGHVGSRVAVTVAKEAGLEL